jgi:hypothetical protein
MIEKSTTRRNLALAGVGTAAGLLLMSLIVSSANAKDKEIAPTTTMGGSQKGTTAQGPHGGPKKKAVNPTTDCDVKPCPKKGN